MVYVGRRMDYYGNVEKLSGNAYGNIWFYYLSNDVLYVKKQGVQDSVYHICRDNLGSVMKIVASDGRIAFHASYDAWGLQTKHVNSLKFYRGYTGHEMIPEVSLINMNGRMYDPKLGRFLSPDNYVQLPDNPQNLNRYSYCLNNPLKYTDPSGELIGTIITAFVNLVSNVVNHGFNTHVYDWTKTKYAWKIDTAPFKGKPRNVICNLTWGFPNTVLGNVTAHSLNIIGNIDGVSEMDGLTAVGGITSGEQAFTIGPYSFGPKNYKATWKDHLFVHEYGHYLQHLDWGALYIPIIGSTSLTSAFGIEDSNKSHSSRWFEIDASKRGANFFDQNYGYQSKKYKYEISINPDGINKNNYFDKEAFSKKSESYYINPRNGYNNANAHPIHSSDWDWFDLIVPMFTFCFF